MVLFKHNELFKDNYLKTTMSLLNYSLINMSFFEKKKKLRTKKIYKIISKTSEYSIILPHKKFLQYTKSVTDELKKFRYDKRQNYLTKKNISKRELTKRYFKVFKFYRCKKSSFLKSHWFRRTHLYFYLNQSISKVYFKFVSNQIFIFYNFSKLFLSTLRQESSMRSNLSFKGSSFFYKKNVESSSELLHNSLLNLNAKPSKDVIKKYIIILNIFMKKYYSFIFKAEMLFYRLWIFSKISKILLLLLVL